MLSCRLLSDCLFEDCLTVVSCILDKSLCAVQQPLCRPKPHEVVILALFDSLCVLSLQKLSLVDALIASLHTLLGCPRGSLEKSFSFSLSIFDRILDLLQFLFQLSVLCYQFAVLNLDFIGVFDGRVHKLETCVGPVALLLYNCDIFSESLICLFQFLLQSLNFLVLQMLSIGLFLSDRPSERFDFSCHLGFDALDLLVLTLSPDFVQVRKHSVHHRFRYVRSTFVSKVVSDLVCVFGDPIFLLCTLRFD